MGLMNTPNLRLLNINPFIATVDDFLSGDDCQSLIQAASGSLERSKIVNAGAEKVESERRTNSNARVTKEQSPAVPRMLMLLSMYLRLPITHAEGLQILHYGPGQEFKPHHDGFSLDDKPQRTEMYEKSGGQRLFSTMVYLNDVDAGGSTDFPNLDLSVAPKQGRLLIFANTGAGSRFMTTLSLHAGTPVTQGEKWSAITWWRENPRPEGKRAV